MAERRRLTERERSILVGVIGGAVLGLIADEVLVLAVLGAILGAVHDLAAYVPDRWFGGRKDDHE